MSDNSSVSKNDINSPSQDEIHESHQNQEFIKTVEAENPNEISIDLMNLSLEESSPKNPRRTSAMVNSAKETTRWMDLIVSNLEDYISSTNFVGISIMDIDIYLCNIIESSKNAIKNSPTPANVRKRINTKENGVIVEYGTLDLLLQNISKLSQKISEAHKVQEIIITYEFAVNFAEIIGEFLYNVVTEYQIKYGIQKLGEYAIQYVKECPAIWNIANDDGFFDVFGIVISLMKFQDSPDASDASMVSSITEFTADTTIEDTESSIDNDEIISHILNFYHKVRKSVKEDSIIDEEFTTNIICGMVYSVLNPQAARVMKYLISMDRTLPAVRKDNSYKTKINYLLFRYFSTASYHTLDSIQGFYDFFVKHYQVNNKYDSNVWAKFLDMSLYIRTLEDFIPEVTQIMMKKHGFNDDFKNILEVLYELLKINFEDEQVLNEKRTELDFKFVEFIPNAADLAIVRQIFDILPPPETKTVFRGPYTLSEVEYAYALGQNNPNTKVYRISKTSPLRTTKSDKGTFVILDESVFEKPKWINARAEMTDEDLQELIMQELLSKKRYVRIASWNVACMNNFDLPSTEEQLDIKIDNIVKVIINSKCDIVALQELPYVITFSDEEANRSNDSGNNSPKKIQKKFDYLRQRLQDKLQEVSNDSWVIEWSTSFYENYDARKGRGVLAFAYNSDVVEAQHPYNVELRVNDKRKEETRVKRMPICGSFRIGMLEFILVNVHLSPKNAVYEANDLAANLIPKLEEHYGNLKSQSVIFLGDFNMSYTTKGMFAKPKPGDDTWSPLIQNGFVPCIKDCFTNVVQSNCYDNIWIHKTMTSVLHKNPKALGLEEKGVKEIIHILQPGKRILKSDMKAFFQKQASDHNMVFIDLRIHKVMPWSESIRIEEEKIVNDVNV